MFQNDLPLSPSRSCKLTGVPKTEGPTNLITIVNHTFSLSTQVSIINITHNKLTQVLPSTIK